MNTFTSRLSLCLSKLGYKSVHRWQHTPIKAAAQRDNAIPVITAKSKYQRRLVLMLCSSQLCWIPNVAAQWYRESFTTMGTQAYVEYWTDDATIGASGIEQVKAEFSRVNALMSPWIESSELSQLNRFAATTPVTISTELYQLLQKAASISALSHGAFDITFASVGFSYDYRTGKKPNAAQLAQQKALIDYRQVKLLPNSQVRFGKTGVKIDLGGIAKGYTVERAIHLLQQRGIKHAQVSAGGDSRLLGDKRGKPWLVAIKHPRDDHRYAAQLPLSDSAISTSGDYERYFLDGEQRYHHILDPKTGQSANRMMSVSVIGPDATTTDALSTTLFVLGLEQGLALIEQLPGYEAVFITADRRLFYSKGLQ